MENVPQMVVSWWFTFTMVDSKETTKKKNKQKQSAIEKNGVPWKIHPKIEKPDCGETWNVWSNIWVLEIPRGVWVTPLWGHLAVVNGLRKTLGLDFQGCSFGLGLKPPNPGFTNI